MLLARLKQATQFDHHRTEQALNLLREDLMPGHYVAILRAFYGFYEPWERAARPITRRLVAALGEREKTPLLRRDLRHFQHTDEQVASLPRCTTMPELEDLPETLGSMYVLEGATLGGEVISRHVERVLGLENSAGCAFFSSYGEEVGARWRMFRDCLVALSPRGTEQRVIDSARRTFQYLHRWLIECEVAA
jgi:heme oxygenase